MVAARPRPTGLVTFFFTDIEGSTQRWERYAATMKEDLQRHDTVMHRCIEKKGGHVFKTMGDAFCAVFNDPTAAILAAVTAQNELAGQSWGPPGTLRVRMALHSGVVEETGNDYFGPPVNRVARILSAGHGGQILLSGATADLLIGRLPEGVSLRDMGERRLKDLASPERILQIVAPSLTSEFPALRTLDARSNNLPAQLTPLVGREEIVSQVGSLLRRPDVRLVTLTGCGGTGKTRVALQVAANLIDEFSHGVWFISLAALSDPELVPTAIAAALQLGVGGRESELVQISQHLREREVLLLLDNFENVLAAAPQVATLLSSAPRVKVLVTSRALLRIQGEHDFPVSPLEESESARLFLERARAARPNFTLPPEEAGLLAEVCYRLDRLPLALELAAARVRLLPLRALHRRLCGAEGHGSLQLLTGGAQDAPARQRTLRSAIAWSYQLLSPSEQVFFRRLSVFSGGFTIEAAEAVSEPGVDLTALDALANLVDQSLVLESDEGANPRFRLLQTLQEFALEQLAAGEASDARARHAGYYLKVARQADAELAHATTQSPLVLLEREHDNMRAALGFLQAGRNIAMGLELCIALSRFWDLRGHWEEGLRWLKAFLGEEDGSLPHLRARALHWVGVLAFPRGQLGYALSSHLESLELFRAAGDQAGVADALDRLQWVYMYGGRQVEGADACEKGLSVARALGDPQRLARAIGQTAWMAFEKGDRRQAVTLYRESVSMLEHLPDQAALAKTLNALGEALRGCGEYLQAQEAYERSYALARQLGIKRQLAPCVFNLGMIARHLGKLERAAQLFRESIHLNTETGGRHNVPLQILALATLSALGNRADRAARLIGSAEELLKSLGVTVTFADRENYETALRETQARLSAQAFSSLCAEGRALSYDAAIQYALGD